MAQHAEHHSHPKYGLIWFVLAALTAVEVGVAMLGALGREALILLLIALAVWKALLVALYFMHLRFETFRLWVLATIPVAAALGLVSLSLTGL